MVVSSPRNPFSNLTTVILQWDVLHYDHSCPTLSVKVLAFFLALPAVTTVHARAIDWSSFDRSTMLLPKTSNVREFSFEGGIFEANELDRLIRCPRKLRSFKIYSPESYYFCLPIDGVWEALQSHARESLQELTVRIHSGGFDSQLEKWAKFPDLRSLRTGLAMFLPCNMPCRDVWLKKSFACQELELFEDDSVYHLSALRNLLDVLSVDNDILPNLEFLRLKLCEDSWQFQIDKEERQQLLDKLVACCKAKQAKIILDISLPARFMNDSMP